MKEINSKLTQHGEMTMDFTWTPYENPEFKEAMRGWAELAAHIPQSKRPIDVRFLEWANRDRIGDLISYVFDVAPLFEGHAPVLLKNEFTASYLSQCDTARKISKLQLLCAEIPVDRYLFLRD